VEFCVALTPERRRENEVKGMGRRDSQAEIENAFDQQLEKVEAQLIRITREYPGLDDATEVTVEYLAEAYARRATEEIIREFKERNTNETHSYQRQPAPRTR
jgi:hypothetical protein